jgi:osmotically-inducible protein OsmY
MKSLVRLLLSLLILSQLGGCAVLVVGGAAATGMALHDRRSVGTVIDDNVLKVRVRDTIYRQALADDEARLRVKVNAHNGWVLLAGEAIDQSRIDHIGRVAEDVDGVERLFNELKPLGRVGARGATSDKWISTRVNGSLTRIRDMPGFDATRVKVLTANGVVYLMGNVSRQEAEAAVEQARTVRGVERVVTIFEYSDAPEPPQNGQ